MPAWVGALVAVILALALPSAAAAAGPVVIDGQATGRTFDGVGAISASSSRLLVDYPARQRAEILDYLFKPKYGASLQILKTEIGGDTNSTAGSEPSHMRTPDQVDCNRGFEWWLMKEAKRRNPEIKLYGLLWGAPGWFDPWLWSEDHVDYIVKWLDCAREHGLEIDYVGGGNERGSYDIPFFKLLDAALAQHHPDVEIVATDQHVPPDYWQVADDMALDPDFNGAIDVIGQHNPCGWRTLYLHCSITQTALDLDKPLWTSESSTQDAAAGAGPLARARNRNYIDARITGDIQWSAVAAFYGNFHTAGTGLMVAEWPWSGHYDVDDPIWIDAHTTQFTEPGWQYLDSGSGYLDSGASHVALRSNESDDYTIVIETMDSTAAETVEFDVTGGLSRHPLHVWSTEVDSDDPDAVFARRRPIRIRHGRFGVRLEPGHVYTLSTTTGQRKGNARPPTDPDVRMPLPYGEDFEAAGPDRLAPLFADLNGAYETAPCGAGRGGTCYRQVITRQPINWQRAGLLDPATLVGDPRWWGDYRVTAQAMLEQPGYVELLGRIERYAKPDGGTGAGETGYHLRVGDGGAWSLYREGPNGEQHELAAGQTAFGVGRWHRLGLEFQGSSITASIDGTELGSAEDVHHSTGQVGLRTSKWQNAQFDDLRVAPTGPAPNVLPRARMTATATSEQPGPYEHHFFKPEWALDGRPMTQWTARMDGTPQLPQSITVKLGRRRAVGGLVYKPPVGNVRVGYSGIITGYRIAVSTDGRRFREVASGSWTPDVSTKVVRWSRAQQARYVRLEAIAADGGVAGASEIDLIGRPALRNDENPAIAGFPRDAPKRTRTSTRLSRTRPST
jgi:Glycosyl hydrolase family 59/F5/8 type C domain/Glycosyl hydrolase family 59 central domain